MKKRYKIYGDIVQNYLEINFDFSRWLVGFGWCGSHFKVVHINLGPLAILYCWSKDETSKSD